MSETHPPDERPADEHASDDALERSLRAMRPQKAGLDESAVFYQAGFAAGQASTAPVASDAGFRITHLVAAAGLSALLCGSTAYWFAKNGAQPVDGRPLIAVDANDRNATVLPQALPTPDPGTAIVSGSDEDLDPELSAIASPAVPRGRSAVSDSLVAIRRAELWASLVESVNRESMIVPEPTTLAVFHSSRWQWLSNELPPELTSIAKTQVRAIAAPTEDLPRQQAGNRQLSNQMLKEIR